MANKKEKVNTIDISQTGPLTFSQLQALNGQSAEESQLGKILDIQIAASGYEWGHSNPLESQDVEVNSSLNKGTDYWGNSIWDDTDHAKSEAEFEQLGDERANNQWAIAKIGAGITKGIILAGTTFADSTAGLLVGLINGFANMADGDENTGFWNGFVNNPFAEAMKQITDASEEWLPNYYTQQELTQPWYKNIGTANFWGDKFIKNLGFTAGTIIPGIGYAQVAGKAAKSILTLTRLAKDVEKLGAATSAIARATGTLVSAINEGSTEGFHASKEFFTEKMNGLNNDYTKTLDAAGVKYYIDPRTNKVTLVDNNNIEAMPEEVKNAITNYENSVTDIKNESLSVGNMTFAMNLPILAASDLIQFGRAFSRGFDANNIARTVLTNGIYSAEMSAFEAGTAGVRNALTQALEESLQATAQFTSKDFYGTELDNFLNKRWHPEAEEQTVDWLNSFGKALYENFKASSNTWEEFFIGGLTGALGIPSFSGGKVRWEGGIVAGTRDALNERKEQQQIADDLNARVGTPEFEEYYQAMIRRRAYQNDMDNFLKNGKAFDYKNADHAQLISDIILFAKAGRLQDLTFLIGETAPKNDKELQELIDSTTQVVNNADGTTSYIGPFIDSAGNKMNLEEARGIVDKNTEFVKKTVGEYQKARSEVMRLQGSENFSDEQIEQATFYKMMRTHFIERIGEIHETNKPYYQSLVDRASQDLKDYQDELEAEQANGIESADANRVKELSDNIKQVQSLIGTLNTIINSNPEALAYAFSSHAMEDKNSNSETDEAGETKENKPSLAEILTLLELENDSIIDASEKAALIERIVDTQKLAMAAHTAGTRIKEFIENPGKVTERAENNKRSIKDKIFNRKAKKVADRLSKATSIENLQELIDKEEDKSQIEKALDDIAKYGTAEAKELVKNYRETKQYDELIQEQLDKLPDGAEKRNAKALFASHKKKSKDVKELSNTSSANFSDPNNGNLIENHENLLDDELEEQLNAATERVISAMNAVSEDERFKKMMSDPQPEPKDAGHPMPEGNDNQSANNSNTPTGPAATSPINDDVKAQNRKANKVDEKVEALRKALESYKNDPDYDDMLLYDAAQAVKEVKEFLTEEEKALYKEAAKAFNAKSETKKEEESSKEEETKPTEEEEKEEDKPVTIDNIPEEVDGEVNEVDEIEFNPEEAVDTVHDETSINAESEREEQEVRDKTTEEGKKAYWAPTLSETNATTETVDGKPVKKRKITIEVLEGYKTLFDYFTNNGVWDFINNGGLFEGAEIRFAIDPALNEKMQQQGYSDPAILIIMRDKQGKDHIIGNMPLNQKSQDTIVGLKDLVKEVYAAWEKADQSKMFVYQGKNGEAITHINKRMNGFVLYGEEHDLNHFFPMDSSSETPIIGVLMRDGSMRLSTDEPINVKNVMSGGSAGAVYLLIPDNYGRYIPVRLNTKRFSKKELSLPANREDDSPVMQGIREAIDLLVEASRLAVAKDALADTRRAEAASALVKALYMNGVHINFREKDGKVYLSIQKNKLNEGREQTDANGNPILDDSSPAWIELDPNSTDEQLAQSIAEALYELNLPFKTDSNRLQDARYVKSLVTSGVFSTNVRQPKVVGAWFTMNPVVNGEEHDAKNPKEKPYVKPEPRQVSTGNTIGGKESVMPEGSISYGGTYYFVEKRNGTVKILDINGNDISEKIKPNDARAIKEIHFLSTLKLGEFGIYRQPASGNYREKAMQKFGNYFYVVTTNSKGEQLQYFVDMTTGKFIRPTSSEWTEVVAKYNQAASKNQANNSTQSSTKNTKNEANPNENEPKKITQRIGVGQSIFGDGHRVSSEDQSEGSLSKDIVDGRGIGRENLEHPVWYQRKGKWHVALASVAFPRTGAIDIVFWREPTASEKAEIEKWLEALRTKKLKSSNRALYDIDSLLHGKKANDYIAEQYKEKEQPSNTSQSSETTNNTPTNTQPTQQEATDEIDMSDYEELEDDEVSETKKEEKTQESEEVRREQERTSDSRYTEITTDIGEKLKLPKNEDDIVEINSFHNPINIRPVKAREGLISYEFRKYERDERGKLVVSPKKGVVFSFTEFSYLSNHPEFKQTLRLVLKEGETLQDVELEQVIINTQKHEASYLLSLLIKKEDGSVRQFTIGVNSISEDLALSVIRPGTFEKLGNEESTTPVSIEGQTEEQKKAADSVDISGLDDLLKSKTPRFGTQSAELELEDTGIEEGSVDHPWERGSIQKTLNKHKQFKAILDTLVRQGILTQEFIDSIEVRYCTFTDGNTDGACDSKRNIIYLDPDHIESLADELGRTSDYEEARVLLHEIIHLVTQRELLSNPEFRDKMQDLFNVAEQAYREQRGSMSMEQQMQLDYAFQEAKRDKDGNVTNNAERLFEFVAEAMSKQEVQQFLNDIKYREKEKESIWQKLVNFIKELLGLTNNDFVSVFDEVLESTIKYSKFSKSATEVREALRTAPRNAQGQLLAPNGKVSNLSDPYIWAEVRTSAFKAWFGDWENDPENASKIVDENGEPLIVYHGSPNKNIEVFRHNEQERQGGRGTGTEGYYFSPKKGYAERYTVENLLRPKENEGTIYEVFLDIKNPVEFNAINYPNADIRSFYNMHEEDRAMFEKDGHDGVYMGDIGTNSKSKRPEIVVFDPNQVKSATDNNWEFSKDLSILKSQTQREALEKENPKMMREISRFLDNFEITIQEVDEFGGEHRLFDALNRTIYAKDAKDVTRGTAEAIVFMMQHSSSMRKLVELQMTQERIEESGRFEKRLIQGKPISTGVRSDVYKGTNKKQYFDNIITDLETELKRFYNVEDIPSSPYLSKLWDMFTTYYDKISHNDRVKINVAHNIISNIINSISLNDDTIIRTSMYKPGTFEEATIVQVEEAIENNPFERTIIEKLNKHNIPIAGSFAIASQGTLYRPAENPLHDLDFGYAGLEKAEIQSILKEEFGNVEHIRTVANEGEMPNCETFLYLDRPFTINKPLSGMAAYTIIDENGNQIGSFIGSNLVLNEGVAGKFLDFFIAKDKKVLTPNVLNVAGKAYLYENADVALSVKVEWARNKDIWDYNNYVTKEHLHNMNINQEYRDRYIREKLKNATVIWGHPALGKTTYLENHDDILEWDDLVHEERYEFIKNQIDPNDTMDPKEYREARSKYMQEWKKHPEYVQFLTTKWNELVERAKTEHKRLFASPLPLLEIGIRDFDLIINVSQREFVHRNIKREAGDFYSSTYWKQAINRELVKMDQSKIITTNDYFSDFMRKYDSPTIEFTESEINSLKEQGVTEAELATLTNEEKEELRRCRL